MKKILIISPYFAPENMVASIRFTKIAKYLKYMGYNVTVICSENMAVSTKDRILEDDSRSLDKIYRLPPFSFNQWVKKVYSRIEKKDSDSKVKSQTKIVTKESSSLFSKLVNSEIYHKFLGNWIYAMEILQGYAFIKFVKKNKKELGQFDCVLSTYGPISSHILAEYMKKNGMCQCWVADFRDVVYDVMGKEKGVDLKRKKRLARACVKANYVTAITMEMLKSLCKYAEHFYRKSLAGKTYCISNGFDAEDRKYLTERTKSECLEFVYCGFIYSTGNKILSNPGPLFHAIRELIDEKKIDKEKIVFHYAGRTYDDFYRVAERYGLGDKTCNHGFVERIEAINLQKNADIILSLSWNTKKDKGIMTGKIYEALLVEKNVLCLVSGDEPNSDLKKMIESNNVGFVWEEGSGKDISEIKEWLMQLYSEKMCDGVVSYHGDKEKIKRHSYEYLSQKIEKVFNV